MEPGTTAAAFLAALPWVLLAASEIIAQIPWLRENSVLQIVIAALRKAFPYESDTDTK